MRQVQRAWYGDGIVEVTHGLLLLLIALYAFWRDTHLSTDAAVTVVRYVSPLLILVAAFAARRGAVLLKKRLTVGRPLAVYDVWTEGRRRRALWLAGVTLAAGVVWGTVRLSRASSGEVPVSRWTSLFLGLGLGVAFLYLANRLSLLRFHVLAAASGLLGAAAAALTEESTVVSAGVAYLVAMGALLLGSGAVHLLRFLIRNDSRTA